MNYLKTKAESAIARRAFLINGRSPRRRGGSMTRKQKKMLVRILASAALLAVCLFLPFKGVARLLAFLVPYAVCGWDVVRSAARNIFAGQVFDEKFLMTVATAGAFALTEYPEAVAVMLFYQVGELFESIAVGRSRKSISSLMNIRPDTATVLRGGEETVVSPDEVSVGETVVIRPGERVPLDGIIESGFTTVDASALTGESMPSDKGPGDRMLSGTVNLTGAVRVITDSAFAESTVSRILDLVENASSRKSKAENFITRFARWYTPCVSAGAVLIALVPPLAFGQPFAGWIRSALVFLMVSCPCALVVSVPLSFFGGLGAASREGILIKGSNYLEALSKVNTAVFDKTGTLTRGEFAASGAYPEGIGREELIYLTAGAESRSNHPIARSILALCGQPVDPSRVTDVTERAGRGVEALVDGRKILAGNRRMMEEAGVSVPKASGTAVFVSEGKRYLGRIEIEDQIKTDAKEALIKLRSQGVTRTVLLTGDSPFAAEKVAGALQIDETHASLLPADKVSRVEALKGPGKTVMFVGDGINDAPVIALADVGVAMGALGSDAAIEAADVVLMDDKPASLPRAVAIARKTMRIVRENIAFSLLVKAAILILSAFGAAEIWLAVVADVGVLIAATANAMRALRA